MHVWKAAPGALQVRVGPLRPHIFGARLYFRHQNGVQEITGTQQSDDTALFDVSTAQVAEIHAKNAYLFVTTRHVLHPGSADLQWGWRYKLIQGPANLNAGDETGAALTLDGQGFFNSPLQPFDDPVELSRETVVLP